MIYSTEYIARPETSKGGFEKRRRDFTIPRGSKKGGGGGRSSHRCNHRIARAHASSRPPRHRSPFFSRRSKVARPRQRINIPSHPATENLSAWAISISFLSLSLSLSLRKNEPRETMLAKRGRNPRSLTRREGGRRGWACFPPPFGQKNRGKRFDSPW